MNKGRLKRQALRVAILAGVTLAIGQALQAMGLIGLKRFTWEGVAFTLLGVAVALLGYTYLKEEYRKQDAPKRVAGSSARDRRT